LVCVGKHYNIYTQILHNLISVGENYMRNFKYKKINHSRRMRWAGHVARMGAKRNAQRKLVGTPEGKRPLGRSKYR
jgi:hypothetical protein